MKLEVNLGLENFNDGRIEMWVLKFWEIMGKRRGNRLRKEISGGRGSCYWRKGEKRLDEGREEWSEVFFFKERDYVLILKEKSGVLYYFELIL